MQSVISLRHIGALGTIGEGSYIEPDSRFFDRTTTDDLTQATSKYRQFVENDLGDMLSAEQADVLQGVFWELIDAREQYVYEAGLRSGFQLANDLSTRPPSIVEIERQVREQRLAAARAKKTAPLQVIEKNISQEAPIVDKVVYQEAVKVGKERIRDANEALKELTRVSNIKLDDMGRWGRAYAQARDSEDELGRHIEFVGQLLEGEGPEALEQFKRDVGIGRDDGPVLWEE